jgi:putative endonuclease
MYIVYVITSLNYGFTYVGLTNNLERRLEQHNHRKSRSTKPYAPFQLVYYETVEDRISARVREKYLKCTAGKNYLKKILTNQGVLL